MSSDTCKQESVQWICERGGPSILSSYNSISITIDQGQSVAAMLSTDSIHHQDYHRYGCNQKNISLISVLDML